MNGLAEIVKPKWPAILRLSLTCARCYPNIRLLFLFPSFSQFREVVTHERLAVCPGKPG